MAREEKEVALPSHRRGRLAEYQTHLARMLRAGSVLSAPKAIHRNTAEARDTLIPRTLDGVLADHMPWLDENERLHSSINEDYRSVDKDSPVTQQVILNDITSNKRSYLLLAPAGMGKSVMLESFARQMIANASSVHSGDSLASEVRIPVLVRLRDFNGLKEGIGIRELLELATQKLFAGNDVPRLLPADIELLASGGLLVPLFDGFDEFVHREDFCHRLRAELNEGGLLHECGFVVTSRHDADVMQIPVELEYHRTLRPLTDTEIKEYVAVKRKLPATELDKAPGPISRLLSQPLYLCIWCNCITRDGKAPDTLGKLMLALVADYLERRGRLATHEDCKKGLSTLPAREAALKSKRNLYARVCAILAAKGFGTAVAISDPNIAYLSESDLSEVTDLVNRAGLIEIIAADSGAELYVNQIPVIEYLVGWQLAQAFGKSQDTKSRRSALDLWCRWAWQPAMHTVLDYFFDALWNSGDPFQEQAARDLTGWLIETSNRDLASDAADNAETPSEYCSDDLLRPFCITALRFIDLNQGLRADDAVLTNACTAIVRLARRTDVRNPFGHLNQVVALLRPVTLRRLIEQYVWTAAGEESIGRVLDRGFLAGMTPTQAAFVLEHAREWRLAAERCNNAEAIRRIDKLIGRATPPVDEASALECVTQWLQSARDSNTDTESTVRDAISEASARIPESAALDCLNGWLHAVRDPENSGIMQRLGCAIAGVAGRIDMASAFDCVKMLLRAAREPENANIEHHLGEAIANAANRVSDTSALDCVEELLQAGRDTINNYIQGSIGSAIGFAASRIPDNSALIAVTEWLQKSLNPGVSSYTLEHLKRAIRNGAGRIPEALSLGCFRGWLQELSNLGDSRKHEDTRRRIGAAISGVTRRIPESSALKCVRELLEDGNFDCTEYALKFVTKRIPVSSGLACLKILLNVDDDGDDDTFRKVYENGWEPIDALVEGVGQGVLVQIASREQLEAAQCAIRRHKTDLAIHIASTGTEVAILSRRPRFQGSTTQIKWVYGVRGRHEMALDADSPATPKGIQKLLKPHVGESEGTQELIDTSLAAPVACDASIIKTLKIGRERPPSLERNSSANGGALAGAEAPIGSEQRGTVQSVTPAASLPDVEWPDWYRPTGDQLRVGDAKRLLEHFGFAFTRKNHDSERLTEICTDEAETFMRRQVRSTGKGPGRRIDREDLERLIRAKDAAVRAASSHEKKS